MNHKKLLIPALLSCLIVIAALAGISMTRRGQEAEALQTEPQVGTVWKEPVTGMEFVWVPTGNFMMGFNEGEVDEQPVHKVHISGFWMGKYEVTQGQWKAIMNENKAKFIKGDNYPMETVDWDETLDFIHKLSSRSGHRFRLPTEAEWEYACKAGTNLQQYGDPGDIAWNVENTSRTTHPVGQKKPNAWSLYDMLGNVWEWCQDWYGEKYYAASPPNNPKGPTSGDERVFRGGSWFWPAVDTRAAVRFSSDQGFRISWLGFRLARVQSSY